MRLVAAACLLCILVPGLCVAQSPSGTITGIVRDSSGGVITGALVHAVNRATGQRRMTTAGIHGEYAFPALLPREYELSVEAIGFRRIARAVTVVAGTTTRVNFALQVGDLADVVVVQAASPPIHHDSAAVGAVIARDQIQGVPLNGRSFLELAKLEPGLQPPVGTNRNRTIVAILGAPASNVGGARFTIDGGSITSVGLGGAQMGFSQEVVQEFQVSTVNFAISTGMTDAGAINIVTRAGGNQPQATAFYFFRDHHLAAYPSLQRDPENPDPFFQRQQFGVALGGPVRRNRVFYFASWERNDQRAVSATTLLAPDFAHLSRITRAPLSGDLFSLRVDATVARMHNVFIRHSHDGSRAFGPAASVSGGSPNAYPSSWNRVAARADQSLVALTSVLRATLVNDLRVSVFGNQSRIEAPGEPECAGCLGLGAPSISILQSGLIIGHSTAINNLGRRFHLNNSMAWHRAAHRLRFGVDWERNQERNLVWGNDPVTITLFSPDRVRAYNAEAGTSAAQPLPLPATFRSIDDILRLPLQSISLGIGDPGVRQEDGGDTRSWNTFWLHAEDTWRMREGLTLTYGLGWGFDSVLNHDLRKPLLLAPILGADGLGPTKQSWTNFSPALGVAWTPSSDNRTVVRAGVGRFHRPHGLTSSLDAERAALGRSGLGRQNLAGSAILNCVPGVSGVPLGIPLNFRNAPTRVTGADVMAILPALRECVARGLVNGDPTVQQIQITKQAFPPSFLLKYPIRRRCT